MKKIFKQFLFCTFFISGFLLCQNALAADIHICDTTVCGQTPGDGSTWSNALNDLPVSLVRGNTYYIADGNYSYHIFNDTEVSETYIYIKKATASAHGSNTGWDNAFGDGQAVWGTEIVSTYEIGIRFRTGYYVFDGVAGLENNSSSYGFAIVPTDPTKHQYLIGIPMIGDSNYQLDHITVSHAAIVTSGEGTGVPTQVGIFSNSNALYPSTNIVISNNYFYNASVNILIRQAQNWTIRDNYFDGNWSSSDNHGEQISPATSNNVFLYNNVFKDSSAFIVGAHNEAGGNTNWEVYNNIIFGNTGEFITAGFAMAESAESDGVISWQVHHNTFVDVVFSGRGAVFAGDLTDVNTQKSYAYNNLFFNCTRPSMSNLDKTLGGVVHDYNAYISSTEYTAATHNQVDDDGSNPFVDSVNGDYAIDITADTANDAHVINTGLTLASPYDVDYIGTERPAGSGFDIGAYEYVGASDVVAPASPTGLSVQ